MNVRRRLIRTSAAAGAVAFGLATLAGCPPTGSADGRSDDGKLAVVASFYPMEFLVRTIGGSHVSVSDLTEPGVEPHDLEVSPRQTAELSDAGLVVYLGGLQPAVDEAIKVAEVKDKVDAADLTHLESHGTSSGHDHGESAGTEHDHGDEHSHGEEGHAEEDHGEEGHDHGGGNAAADPHVWLDPAKYAEIAQGVGGALEKADPKHADAYSRNTDALVARLGRLDKAYKDGLANRTTDTFITTHSAFGYLAERYGLHQEGISGIDPESEPSPARMKDLQALAKKEKVSTVFFETIASDRTAKTLAGDIALRTDVLDPVEGITDESQGRDYFEVMQANLRNLQKALAAT
ncbi:metal ABC transporter substrate-binding protein [Streptomyces sp. NPDC048639]|uniref:metal ABC transporter substrate-binding protein n=1 Tax=Streptomyces sp. NPDC048639 TaxID=3365581 RepID=UPI00371A3DF5